MTLTARRDGQRLATLSAQGKRSSVNKRLTPHTQREAPELGQAIGRMMRALARRCREGDIQALTELYELRRDLAVHTASAALWLNAQHGYSWFEIGRAAGMSRQAAQHRWGGG